MSRHFDILRIVVIAPGSSTPKVQLRPRYWRFFDDLTKMEIWKRRSNLMETKNAISALAALAQESRLATFRLLVQAGPSGMAASKIAETLGIPASSLSFHLKELTHANLISPRQEGRFIIYVAQFDTMNGLLAYLTANCCDGNPCSSVCEVACAESTPKADQA
jgi:DNA-binding transcriptional ArsR family regulator